MSLLAPLFLALLALAAIVVLLHVQRRRTVTVPSVEIWRRLQNAGAERQRRFEWPMPNLLMLLQIAAVALIALALAQPLLGARGPDHLVVLLDTSPAMGARAGDGTRLDAARSAALEAIEAANAGRVSLVGADADPEVLVARQSRTPESLAPFLGPLLAGGGAPDWRDTGGLARGLVHADETTRILWVSSTAVPEALQAELGTADIEPLVVGTGAGNGSLALDLLPGEEGEPWTLVGEARLHGALNQSTLTVSYAPRAGGEPLVWTTRQLGDPDPVPADEPLRTRSIDIDLDLPGPGVVTTALTPRCRPVRRSRLVHRRSGSGRARNPLCRARPAAAAARPAIDRGRLDLPVVRPARGCVALRPRRRRRGGSVASARNQHALDRRRPARRHARARAGRGRRPDQLAGRSSPVARHRLVGPRGRRSIRHRPRRPMAKLSSRPTAHPCSSSRRPPGAATSIWPSIRPAPPGPMRRAFRSLRAIW